MLLPCDLFSVHNIPISRYSQSVYIQYYSSKSSPQNRQNWGWGWGGGCTPPPLSRFETPLSLGFGYCPRPLPQNPHHQSSSTLPTRAIYLFKATATKSVSLSNCLNIRGDYILLCVLSATLKQTGDLHLLWITLFISLINLPVYA